MHRAVTGAPPPSCTLIILLLATAAAQHALTHDALHNRTGLCLYQDRHVNVLRVGFDTCVECTQNCLRWAECAWVRAIPVVVVNTQPHDSQAFYDGANLSRAAIPPFDCDTHTLASLGFDPGRLHGGLAPVVPVRDTNWFTLTEPVRACKTTRNETLDTL